MYTASQGLGLKRSLPGSIPVVINGSKSISNLTLTLTLTITLPLTLTLTLPLPLTLTLTLTPTLTRRALADVIRPADLHIFEVVRQDDDRTGAQGLAPPRPRDKCASTSASTSPECSSASASAQATPSPRRATTPSDEDARRLFADLELRQPSPSMKTGDLRDTPAAPPRLRTESTMLSWTI